ncbi:hypothetical protein MKQ70_12815 [Chitinophaga sedimenti]|uniref:hypothetical protein n=1 Tax=Chitinophaga sedimenti TaxID=2033606 RepID=UPI002004D335|nr:hypothetical protein [Chitinophaga sedimenti]MCK7555848.1 hypothetical protein [Chitinophaga sedimenti]
MSAVPAKGSADLQVCSLTEDSVTFELKTAQPQQIYLRVQTRGLLQSIASGMLKDSLRVTVPIKEMPAGMAEATLYDAQLRPLTSTWFNAHPERRLHISFTEVKKEYGVKAAISVRIKTTDADGKPVPAALTLRVTDHLFLNAANARDIAGYYYEETQLTGEVDLNKTMPVLSDSLRGTVTPLSRKDPKSLSLLVFNYNKSISQFAATNNEGVFYLTPEHLAMGRRFFVRYFSDKEYKVQIAQPFKAIAAAGKPIYQLGEKALIAADSRADTNLMQYGRTLQGVQIQSKGRGFSDKYLGYLDSIARFEGNTDFVGVCGGLNCPACGSGTKPEEGVSYWELTEPRRSQCSVTRFLMVLTICGR